MNISGQLDAKCKVCCCIFTWSMSRFPFHDAEIVGSCSECFNKESHDIYNDNVVQNFNSKIPVVFARIVFDKGTYHFESPKGKFLKKSQVVRLMYWGKQIPIMVKKYKRKKKVGSKWQEKEKTLMKICGKEHLQQ